jgi:hypothetical protein
MLRGGQPGGLAHILGSVDDGNRQGLGDRNQKTAAATGEAVDNAPPDPDHESAESEQDAAGAEGDIERHDFIPRWWSVMGAMSRKGSLPAMTGSP